MTAKEMFEELGYTYNFYCDDYDCGTISYYMRPSQEKDIPQYEKVCFHIGSKIIGLDNVLCIDTKLLQAINKQVEELGWK